MEVGTVCGPLKRRFALSQITLRELLEAGVHFGHQVKRWNPKMKPYIFGARNGIHIIDLQKTLRLFNDALHFVSRTASDGESIMFVGTKPQAQLVVEEEAKRARMPYVTNRWLGGTLTNFVTLRKSLERIDAIENMLAEGNVEKLPKKEVVRLEKELLRMNRNLRGLRTLKGLPGAVVVIDPNREKIAVREANRLGIPVVALVDTNCDPDNVSHVVPGNDDAIRAIRLIISSVATACIEGGQAKGEGWDGGVPVAAAGRDEAGPEVVVRGVRAPTAEPVTDEVN